MIINFILALYKFGLLCIGRKSCSIASCACLIIFVIFIEFKTIEKYLIKTCSSCGCALLVVLKFLNNSELNKYLKKCQTCPRTYATNPSANTKQTELIWN